MLLLALSCLADKVYSELQPKPLERLEAPAGFGPSAASCAGCHTEIHAEWAASKLGQAHICSALHPRVHLSMDTLIVQH